MHNDSSPDNPHIAAQLKALQQTYARELPAKLDEINDYWKMLMEKGWCDTVITEMHRKTHSLAGSGASFGFPMVSKYARELEMEIKSAREQGGLLENDKQSLIELRLNKLLSSATKSEGVQMLCNGNVAAHNYDPELILLYDGHNVVTAAMMDELGKFGYKSELFASEQQLTDKLNQVNPAGIFIYQTGNKPIPVSFKTYQTGARNSLPIIVIANDDNFELRLAATRAGSHAFFTDNADMALLVDKIDKLNKLDYTTPFRILIIDDSETLATQYALILKQAGMIAKIVTNPLQISDSLSAFHPDLILVDMYMPEYNGDELVRVLRQHETYIGTPIVFLSAETNVDKQIGAMSVGGDDFLTKPIHPEHLVSSITNRVERYRVLRAMMENDSLTGLLNQSKIREQLEVELSRAIRQHRPMTFAMIDLDDFKQINDTYGHTVGDQTLKLLSRVMKQRLRRTDIIGRYGGEEFAIVLPDTNLEKATDLLENVRQTFARIPVHAGDAAFSITLSCGVAAYPDYDNASGLYEAADAALYSAKKTGKNCIVVNQP